MLISERCRSKVENRIEFEKRREEIEAQEQENLLGARNVEQERIQVGEKNCQACNTLLQSTCRDSWLQEV